MNYRQMILAGVVVVLLGITGCHSLNQTAAERAHTGQTIRDREMGMLVEDIDVATLRHHPSRLSRWH